ncbi:hypothetical protein PILCRDRAFT_343888 [Piloderma croceum F 1598]|uniref:Uncharacterized protein n=1 Tax=Piloderma croceum (strain F 1598) TaxID=765440 RepID=A0A0C3FP95_PILCF|nr:hypothetical protein PILCRDRAFT_343888 [Piloderma croceum F 1598]
MKNKPVDAVDLVNYNTASVTKTKCTYITSSCRSSTLMHRKLLGPHLTRDCICCRPIVPDIAFTCIIIVLGIVLAVALFYQALHLQWAYFTRCCIYLEHNFTGQCNSYRHILLAIVFTCSIILLGIGFAAGLFYQVLY